MLGRLVTRWQDIVGPELADKTQPVKIRTIKGRKSGESTASLDIATTTADATLLHYQKDLILQRINHIFGDRWISALRFVPVASNAPARFRPPPAKPLTAAEKSYLSGVLEGVQDPEIQDRLMRLGTAIMQEKQP